MTDTEGCIASYRRWLRLGHIAEPGGRSIWFRRGVCVSAVGLTPGARVLVRWRTIARIADVATRVLPRVQWVRIADEHLEDLADDLCANVLELDNCRRLRRLGVERRVLALRAIRCAALVDLGDRLDLRSLWLDGCTALASLPGDLRVVDTLGLIDCPRIRALPPGARRLRRLWLRGDGGLRELPEDLVVTHLLEVGGLRLSALPDGCRDAALFWKGVRVDAATLLGWRDVTAADVRAERNSGRREVLIEQLGLEGLRRDAELVDEDDDGSGRRRLLRVRFPAFDHVVWLSVRCPSTGQPYDLRVPPHVTSCVQAASWLAGFSGRVAFREET